MNETIAQQLIALNRNFYDQFAADWSTSRVVLNPGVMRTLQQLAHSPQLLDVGCGDARVGRFWLAQSPPQAGELRYWGVDHSAALLACHPLPAGGQLWQADICQPGWAVALTDAPQASAKFSAIVCFAVLHHIPPPYHLPLLHSLADLLAENGLLTISVWQFLHVPRLARKIVPWEAHGFAPQELTANDYLLDWHSQRGRGVRYVHAFSAERLTALLAEAGLQVRETFRSDGESGDMGLYLHCEKKNGQE